MAIEILYQDEDVIAVSKPSGQVTIPGRGESIGIPLTEELEKFLGRKPFIVHRLDRGASGIVLFAKNAAAHRHLNQQFEQRLAKKSYHVLVQGTVEKEGHIDQPLREFGSGRIGVHKDGKASVTDYTVAEIFPTSTLLNVSPQTGRRHQIRVHLYSIGHAVMGDTLYGKERPVGGAPRLMLHASTLELEGPQGWPLAFNAERPEDFKDVLRACAASAKPKL